MYSCDLDDLRSWLLDEYDPARLADGCGLVTGEFIQVRQHEGEAWQRRKFLFYADGIFYVTPSHNGIYSSGVHYGYKQARRAH